MSKPDTTQVVSGHTPGNWVTPTAHTIVLAEALDVASSTSLRVVETPPAPSIQTNACESATVVMAVQTTVPLGSPLSTRLAEGGGNLNIDTDKPSFADHQALSFVMGRIEVAANMQEWTPCSSDVGSAEGKGKKGAQCGAHCAGSDGRVVECALCAPAPPRIKWVNMPKPKKEYGGTGKDTAKKTKEEEEKFKKKLAKYNKDLAEGKLAQQPREDTKQAAKFEKALRRKVCCEPKSTPAWNERKQPIRCMSSLSTHSMNGL